MTRLAFGDMAQPTDQVKASGNLEIVLALTISEVSAALFFYPGCYVWFSSGVCSGCALGVVMAHPPTKAEPKAIKNGAGADSQ
jgi:hypothetical protein